MMKTVLKVLGVMLLLCLLSSQANAKYIASEYITYTIGDATKKWSLPNVTVGSLNCTAAQGMAIGQKYCYVAKQKDDTNCAIRRINMDTGTGEWMSYYSSLTATSTSVCNVMGHANELEIVESIGTNNETWLFVATLKKPWTVARLKVVGNKMYLAGFYKMIKQSDGGNINASALKYVKTVGNDMYFIVKNARGFYTAKFPLNDNGGTKSDPTEVLLYKMFNIDVRSGVFATSNSAYSTRDGIEDWANQGFGYNPIQQVIYVPVWQSTSGSQKNSAILTYNVADYIIDANWENQRNINHYIYPTRTGFMMTDTSVGTFEIESASFRTGKTDKIYFNTNSEDAAREAVFEVTLSTSDFTPVNEGKTTYTVKYNANGGSGSMSSTHHINGIASRISPNAFTRSGYTFGGWYIYRASDKKWLYVKEDGGAGWYQKGDQPIGAVLLAREDERKFQGLSDVDGDIVTLYAYWLPNTTSTKKFYVRYDANGGTGTMGETAVTYGTSTSTIKNAFTREGYTFVGWTAYRHNKAQWCYKDITAFEDKWLGGTEDKNGYVYKTYSDGAGVAKTTSVDGDIVTFYAVWAKVADGIMPEKIAAGAEFELGGALECNTDMYGVIVRIKDSEGNEVSSYATTTYSSRTSQTNGFDLAQANNTIDFSTLDLGNYTCEVVVQAIAGSTPYEVEVDTYPFEVVEEGLIPDVPVTTFNDNITSMYEVWNYSVEKDNTVSAPWLNVSLTDNFTRDIAVNGSNLYVLNCKLWGTPEINILEASTGVPKGTMSVSGISDGRCALAAIDMLGDKLIGVNAVTNHTLTFYKWDSETATPTKWAEATPGIAMGDHMSVTGDMSNGAIWLISTPTSVIYKYSVANGTVNTTPTIITLGKEIGAQNGNATLAIANDGTMWVDGKDGAPMHFNADGTFIEELPASAFATKNYAGANAVELFQFGTKTYMTATNYVDENFSLSGGAFTLLDLTNGITSANTPIVTCPANGLANGESLRNTQFVNALTHSIVNEGKELYVWVAVSGQGVACYHYNGEKTVTSVDEIPSVENLRVYTDGGTLVVDGIDVVTIELYNLTGKKVQSVAGGNMMTVEALRGIFVVVVTDKDGNRYVKKLAIR